MRNFVCAEQLQKLLLGLVPPGGRVPSGLGSGPIYQHPGLHGVFNVEIGEDVVDPLVKVAALHFVVVVVSLLVVGTVLRLIVVVVL